MATTPSVSASALQALDDASVNRFHRLVTFLSGMGVFLEGYDFTNIASALIFLVPYFQLGAVQISFLAISTYVGTFVGALSVGYLSDRFGRKFMYTWDIVLYGLFAILSALSVNYGMLLFCRAALGFGIGADQALSFTIIAEFAPNKARGRLNASTWIMWTVGSLITYAISYLFLPVFGPNTWRFLFALSVIPAAIVLIRRRALPESPRWLFLQGRTQEAEAVSASTVAGGTGSVASFHADSRDRASRPTPVRPRFSALFASPAQTRRTLYIVFMWFCITVNTYGIGYFTPFIFKTLGFTASRSLLGGMIVAVFAVMGSTIMYLSVERAGRKTLAILGFSLLAAVDLTVSLLAHHLIFGVLLALFSLFQLSAWIGPAGLVGVVAPEVFPTEIRSLGTGFAAGLGRLGSIVGILILPLLLKAVGLSGAMLVFCLDAVVAVAAMILFGTETKGQSLEKLSQ
jgi:putative MFS transporter